MTIKNIYSWQQELWQKLALTRRFRAHALLLKGRAGIGKLDLAMNLAKFRLCDNPLPIGEACGACLSCGWFDKGGHPDFYHVAPEATSSLSDKAAVASEYDELSGKIKPKKKPNQQINVAQIRALSDFVYMTGHQHRQRIVLICPAENMNPAAANALLKKLEEPPLHVLFILVAHRPHHLLPTIRSRCQSINMPTPDVAQATLWLKQRGVIEPEGCLAAASFAPLLALRFNEQNYVMQHNVFIEQISAPQNMNPVALAETMQQSDLPTVVSWMQKWCYDLLSFCVTGKIRYHLSRIEKIQTLTLTIDIKALITFLRSLQSSQQLSSYPLNPRLFLEEIFLTYAALISSDSME